MSGEEEEEGFYERRLRQEIEKIDAQIGDLRQEQYALKQQLVKARLQRHSLRDVTRRNSANRIMVEERILGTLREANRPLPNEKLFQAARLANFELKQATFRTYLLRLKERGLVENPRRGMWKLSEAARTGNV